MDDDMMGGMGMGGAGKRIYSDDDKPDKFAKEPVLGEEDEDDDEGERIEIDSMEEG